MAKKLNVEEQIYVKIINSILYQNREKLNLVIKDHKWAIILITGVIIPNIEVPKTDLFVNK